ncbi:MAG: InlB B-repeat-containing protein [Lachnospiraceae bacterium]|nr:InlB B-repeat-containing protein [Lachnospiraceae bacterium]
MKDLKRKIAAILILALVFNTNAMWTFAESSETFSNLEEISKEEKSTQYVEESLTIETSETSETSVTVALDNKDSGDGNIEENDEPSEDESIVEEPEEDETESNEVPTEPEEDESESETNVDAGSTSVEESESESEDGIASPSEADEDEGEIEISVDESESTGEGSASEDESIATPSDADLIATISEIEFEKVNKRASLSEVVGFDDKLLGADGDAYMQRRLFFDLDGHGTTASGKPAANLKKIIIQIGGDIPEGFDSFGSIGYVDYYDKGTDEDFEVLLYADGVSFTHMHIGTAGLFKDLINLEEIEGFEVVGTGGTVNLEGLFENCKKLRSIRFDNLEASNVVTMSRMFYGCESLTSVDLSNSNTTNVVNMSSMFYGCTSLESVNLTGDFDTSSVTTMEDMFRNCTSLKAIDLSNFKTANVTNFKGMFYGDSKLRIIEVSATDFVPSGIYGDHSGSSNMFYDCTKLVGGTGGNQSNVGSDDYYYKISTQDTGYARGLLTDKNDTSNHILPWSWFDEDLATKNDYIQINIERGTDTSSYTKLYDLDTKGLSVYKKGNILIIHTLGASDTINLGDCNPSIYHSGGGTFAYFNNLKFIKNLNILNTSKTQNMYSLFYADSEIKDLDLTNFNTSRVTNMEYMFCKDIWDYSAPSMSLKTIYVSDAFVTSAETYGADYMFLGCDNLVGGSGTAYSSSHKDKSYARIDRGTTDPGYFTSADNVKHTLEAGWIDSSYKTSARSVTIQKGGDVPSGEEILLDSMGFSYFVDGTNVVIYLADPNQYIYLGNHNVSSGIFSGLQLVTEINGLSNLTTTGLTDMSYMFYHCDNLEVLDLTSFDTNSVTEMKMMFYNCYSLKTIYVTGTFRTDNVTESTNMFYNNTNLKGEKNTAYSHSNPTDKTYAHIDGGTANPGYFTDGSSSIHIIPINWIAHSDRSTYTKIKIIKDVTPPTSGTEYQIDPNGLSYYVDGTEITIYLNDPTETIKLGDGDGALSVFMGFENVESIEGLTNIDTDGLTTLSLLFSDCRKVKFLDLSSFDTSAVTKMRYMFAACDSLAEISVKESMFVTSQVTDSYAMFSGCGSLVGGKGTEFDVTHLDKAYARVDGGPDSDSPGYLTDIDLKEHILKNGWFSGTKADFTKIIIQKGGVEPSGNKTLLDGRGFAYYENDDKITIFVEDNLDTIYLGECKNPSPGVFREFSNVTSIEGLEYLNTSRTVDLSYLFYGCSKIESIDLSASGFDSAIYSRYMFSSCRALTSVKLPTTVNSAIRNLSSMFVNCEKLRYIDLSGYNTSQVTDMSQMFMNCYELRVIYVSNSFNTTNVTSYGSMFYNNRSLHGGIGTLFNGSYTGKDYARIDSLTSKGYFTDVNSTDHILPHYWLSPEDGSGANIRNQYKNITIKKGGEEPSGTKHLVDDRGLNYYVTGEGNNKEATIYLANANEKILLGNCTGSAGGYYDSVFANFSNATKFDGLDLLDTTYTTNMFRLFYDFGTSNTNDKVLDLSSFNTANVTDMREMFGGIYYLKTIYVLPSFVVTNVTSSTDMFNSNSRLVGGQGTAYSTHGAQDKSYAHIDGGTVNPGYFTEKIDKKVTFNYQDGVTDSLEVEVGESGTVTPPVDPTRVGYDFVFWHEDGVDAAFDFTTIITESKTLYAKWDPWNYTLHFNPDASGSHTGSMADMTNLQSGVVYTLNSNAFAWAGHKFLGWATMSDVKPPVWTDGDTSFSHVAQNQNETYNVYALWHEMKYTLHYDLQGGNPDSTFDDVTLSASVSYGLPAAAPTKAHYKFLGWATDPSLDPAYQPGNNFVKDYDPTTYDETSPLPVATLYAKWQKISYRVVYNGNGNTGGTAPTEQTGYAGEALQLRSNSWTRDGYKFLGWDEDQNATVASYSSATSIYMTKADADLSDDSTTVITLYAIWSQIKYTVTYHGNGNTGGAVPDVQTGYTGIELTLSTNTGNLVKTNYRLLGWDESSSATTPTYNLGGPMTKVIAEIDDGKNYNLYAIWSRIDYTIKLNPNNGVGSVIDVPAESGIGKTLPANSFTRTNYKFLGWNTDPNATKDNWQTIGEHYTDLGTVNRTLSESEQGSIYNLYAVWQKMTYTLHYDLQGGTGALVDVTGIASGDNYTLSSTKPTRENYKFIGWATSSTLDPVYQAGDVYRVDFNPSEYDPTQPEPVKTLYAKWEQLVYTVTYNKNGGEGADMPISNGISGENLTLSANGYTRTGYRFRGWDESATPTDPLNPMYPVTGTMTMNKVLTEAQQGTNINVYAIWTQISYIVTYNGNGKTGGDVPDGQTGYSDVPLTLQTNTRNLVKTNKYLLGWDEDASATTPTYALGGSMTKTIAEADDGRYIDLYAIWGDVPYTIKLNLNGGVGSVVDVPAQSGVGKTLPANSFTRTNYKFLGWNTDPNATPANWQTIGEHYDNLGTVNRTLEPSAAGSIYNLYAIWQKYTYTLHYDMNTGSGTIADITDAGSGDNITLSAVRPTKENYTFLGWADDNAATAAQYSAGGTYKATVDSDGVTKTIYAVYSYNYPYTVTFSPNGGSGNMADIIATSSIASPLPGNAFTRSNYTFIGWSENASARSASYTNTITKIVTSAGQVVTLYAIWQYSGGGGGYVPSGGGSGGGGGGGGGGIIGTIQNQINNNLNIPAVAIPTVKSIKAVVNSSQCSWNQNRVSGKWGLNILDMQGQSTVAANGFYVLVKTGETITADMYCFDNNGDMYTGWVTTSLDGNEYYFETLKNSEEGKMAIGWKKVGEDWYYFNLDGTKLKFAVTPDGYFVDANGKWMK